MRWTPIFHHLESLVVNFLSFLLGVREEEQKFPI